MNKKVTSFPYGKVEEFTLLKTRYFSVYVNHLEGVVPLHDHSSNFISVGLRGHYSEHHLWDHSRLFEAPWVRFMRAFDIHTLEARGCWTLVLGFREYREGKYL